MRHGLNWTKVAMFILLLYLFMVLHAALAYVIITRTVDGEVLQKLTEIQEYIEKYPRK